MVSMPIYLTLLSAWNSQARKSPNRPPADKVIGHLIYNYSPTGKNLLVSASLPTSWCAMRWIARLKMLCMFGRKTFEEVYVFSWGRCQHCNCYCIVIFVRIHCASCIAIVCRKYSGKNNVLNRNYSGKNNVLNWNYPTIAIELWISGESWMFPYLIHEIHPNAMAIPRNACVVFYSLVGRILHICPF